MKTAKKPKIKTLIKELDRVFSLFIRKRDHNICITCGKKMTLNQSQCGHYVSRKWLSLRWDEKNCNCQCVSCNVFKHGNMDEYALALKKKYGSRILEELNKKKNEIVKFTADKLTELIKHYSKFI